MTEVDTSNIIRVKVSFSHVVENKICLTFLTEVKHKLTNIPVNMTHLWTQIEHIKYSLCNPQQKHALIYIFLKSTWCISGCLRKKRPRSDEVQHDYNGNGFQHFKHGTEFIDLCSQVTLNFRKAKYLSAYPERSFLCTFASTLFWNKFLLN